MKRTALLLIFYAMLLSAFADDGTFVFRGMRYKILNEEERTCEMMNRVSLQIADVDIPGYAIDQDHGKHYEVIGIGKNAFEGASAVINVVLPETVEYIESYAFGRCHNLKTITIPKSLKSIGTSAFDGPNSLEAVYISDLQAWCNIDFSTVSANPLNSAHSLYLNNQRIDDLVIPDGMTAVKYATFARGYFTSITIPPSVKLIGRCAFYKAKFGGNLVIDENITSIGDLAYAHCVDLKNVVINEGVTSIGEQSFYSCPNVTSITLPESLTSIGSKAFSMCVSLPSITLPSGIKSIPEGTFEGCKNLCTVNFAADVTTIGSGAFKDCASLVQLSIPEQITVIEPNTFANCSALVKVTMPATIMSIGDGAFKNCHKLWNLTLPAALTTIGDEAFMDCWGISKWGLTIPASVTRIGERAFAGVSFSPVVECMTLPEIALSSFNTSGGLYIHQGVSVPFDSPWAEFKAIKYIETKENLVKTVGDYSYLFDYVVKQACLTHIIDKSKSCTSIPAIVTDGNNSYPVTAIANYAFRGCPVKQVTIPGNISYIGVNAFEGCLNVESLHIDESATPLVCGSALGMSTVTELYVGRDINNWSAFENMENIETVTLGNCVTSIPNNALKDRPNLSRLTIGSGVKEIGEFAFHGGLFDTEIVIPSSVKTIGMNAFFGSSLETVYIGSGLSSVGKFAFYGSHPSEVYITAPKAPKASDVVFSALGAGTLYAQTEDALQSYTAAKDRWDHFADFKTMVVAESILTSQEPLHYEAGTTQQLTATVMPEDATLKQIFWRSTNPEIATVSTTGLVTYHRVFDEDGNYVPASEEALDDLRIIATTLYADGPAMAFSTKEVYNGVEAVIPETADGELDYTAPLDVYNLSGLRVAGSIDGLARGIYIVRQGSVVEKIAVK